MFDSPNPGDNGRRVSLLKVVPVEVKIGEGGRALRLARDCSIFVLPDPPGDDDPLTKSGGNPFPPLIPDVERLVSGSGDKDGRLADPSDDRFFVLNGVNRGLGVVLNNLPFPGFKSP